MTQTNPREQKGLDIAKRHDLIRIRDGFYKVHSQTTKREYNVVKCGESWQCDCPDHIFRHVCCKHIHAVEFSLKFKEQVREITKTVIQPVIISSCQFCKSDKIKRFGVRHNKSGDIQRFACLDCHKTFSINVGFEKMKHDPKAVTSAMQLYFTGESLRSVQKFLRLQGVNVSHVTIYTWIKKYTGLMNQYLEKITPQVGDAWRADEIWVKVKGDMKYLFALMDDETRFWIAQEVADSKEKHDASTLFKKGKEVTQTKPKVLITDGLPSYHDAYKKEFWEQDRTKRTLHINHIHLKGDMNNNKMERLNGEIRDREKVVRGLKKKDSPLLKGYQLYHNYVRPHMALNGDTPADRCGIAIMGDNKWLTLIQNAGLKHSTK